MAFYAALDARRTALGLSWADVGARTANRPGRDI